MRLLRIAVMALSVLPAFAAAAGFDAGVNYPWLDYGGDFGGNAWGHRGVSAPRTRSAVAADFAFLRSKGVSVVRWFVFCDGRAGFLYDQRGRVAGLDSFVYQDLDAALGLAQENGIRLIPVLFDFKLLDAAQWVNGVQLGGRANLISDAGARDSLFQNAIEPLLDKYARHPAVLAWEIMNEPENRMGIFRAVSRSEMQAFVARFAGVIHARSGRATLGSAKRSDLDLWKNSGLDLFQYHDYEDVYRSAGSNAGVCSSVDKPLLLGEFPTKNSRVELEGYLDAARGEGLAGALAWSYHAQDPYSDFTSTADRFAAWARAHPNP